MNTNAQKSWAKIGYSVAVFLSLMGVGVALIRYILPHDMHISWTLPFYGTEYANEQFAALEKTPINELVHRVGGSLFFILGLFQFNGSFRKKNWKLHRQLGRLFLLLCIPVGISSLVWAVLVPFGGFAQAVPTFFFAAIFLYASYRAFIHAKRKEINLHKEWILRCFSIALGISTIRIIFFIMDHTVPLGDRELLPISFWLSWSLHLLIAEWWIQATRPKSKRTSKAVVA